MRKRLLKFTQSITLAQPWVEGEQLAIIISSVTLSAGRWAYWDKY